MHSHSETLLTVCSKLFPVEYGCKGQLCGQRVSGLNVLCCHRVSAHVVVVVNLHLLAEGWEQLVAPIGQHRLNGRWFI